MTRVVPSLVEQYTVTLEQYLTGPEEAALSRAYEIGREALARGLGVLDIASIYHDAISAVTGVGAPW